VCAWKEANALQCTRSEIAIQTGQHVHSSQLSAQTYMHMVKPLFNSLFGIQGLVFGNVIIVADKPLVSANPLLREPPVGIVGVNDVEKVTLLEAGPERPLCTNRSRTCPQTVGSQPREGVEADANGVDGHRYLRLFV